MIDIITYRLRIGYHSCRQFGSRHLNKCRYRFRNRSFIDKKKFYSFWKISICLVSMLLICQSQKFEDSTVQMNLENIVKPTFSNLVSKCDDLAKQLLENV